jgi:hypothetical protein
VLFVLASTVAIGPLGDPVEQLDTQNRPAPDPSMAYRGSANIKPYAQRGLRRDCQNMPYFGNAPVVLAVHGEHHLVQVPLVPALGLPTTEIIGIGLP